MTAVVSILFFAFGAVLIAWGDSYRRQGKHFPARYGDSTPPSLIIFCGALAVFLAACVAWFGL